MTEQMRRHEADHDVPWSLPIVVRKSKTAQDVGSSSPTPSACSSWPARKIAANAPWASALET